MNEQCDDLDTLNRGLDANDDRMSQVISVRILFFPCIVFTILYVLPSFDLSHPILDQETSRRLVGVISTILYPGGQFDLISSNKTIYTVAELTHGPDDNRKTVNIGLNSSITVNNNNYCVMD